ncbi:hypothetical protein ADL35_21095, partial [Streptomyces sp. NRRL WC-3753]
CIRDREDGEKRLVAYIVPKAPGIDAAGLRRAAVDPAQGTAQAVLVEPYLAATSVGAADEALSVVPHRLLGLGVGKEELRRYGRAEEHDAAHGLDDGAAHPTRDRRS